MGLVNALYGKTERKNATSSVEPLPKVSSGRHTDRNAESVGDMAYENNYGDGHRTMSSFNAAPMRSKTPLRASSFASFVD